jgi:NAD(P)H-hydrate epimerase
MPNHTWHDVRGNPVPALTTEQMRDVDRVMVEDFGIELLQMMEHAGRQLAHLARQRFLRGDPRGARVTVLAGTGGNGGGAMVAARRLHAWGARVRVVTKAETDGYAGVPRHQLNVLERLDVPTAPWGEGPRLRVPDLVLDGVIGYSLGGAPHGPAEVMIEWMNRVSAPVISLDLPSGLDATTGKPARPTVLAAATMTLALPKTGLGEPRAADHVGELYLADIGVPTELYARLSPGIEVGAIFATDDLIRLR